MAVRGVVYLAECQNEMREKDRQALKIYSPRPYGSDVAYHEDMARLLKVAMMVHSIHNDNLVDVQRFIDDRGIYMMLMPWIDGFDLRQLADDRLLDELRTHVQPQRWANEYDVIYAVPSEKRLRLQPLVAVNIIEKCLRGLIPLHKVGLVHGDIKPSNIMLDINGSIRLIDIGSAHFYKTPPRQRTWSPRYAPPEYLRHGEWTPQSDLASLGYVLVELLSGEPELGGPAVGDDSTRVVDRTRDDALLESKLLLSDRLTDLLPKEIQRTPGLLELCRKLIDPDPRNRFADAKSAMDGDRFSAWNVRNRVIKNGQGVHEVSRITTWIEDVKNMKENRSR